MSDSEWTRFPTDPALGADAAYDAHIQDRPPNFRDEDGHLCLVRCFVCSETEHGRENWAMAVASGQCAWCGWKTRLAEAYRG